MKDYLKRFLGVDDGIETIEFVALIAVAAVLIVVIVNIGTRMKSTADQASSSITGSMDNVDGLMGTGGKTS